MSKKAVRISASSFFWFPATLLATLKLVGVISWPWIAVFAPLWIPLAITLAFLIIFAGAALMALGIVVAAATLLSIEPNKR